MSPHETFFLTNTQIVESSRKSYTITFKYNEKYINDFIYIDINNNPNIQFQIKDFPGTKVLSEHNQSDVQVLKNCGSLIYVIDAHEQDKDMSCNKLFEIIKVARSVNPAISFEVFIHKVDSDMFMQDEQKMDTLNEI